MRESIFNEIKWICHHGTLNIEDRFIDIYIYISLHKKDVLWTYKTEPCQDIVLKFEIEENRYFLFWQSITCWYPIIYIICVR